MTYVVTITCVTCGVDLWGRGFTAPRRSFATLELAELEARILGWKLVDGWVCWWCCQVS